MTQNTLHYRKVINGVGYRFALPILAPPPAAGHLVDIKVAVFTEEVQKQLYAPSLKPGQALRLPKEGDDEEHVTLDVWLAGVVWFLPILNVVAAEDNGKVFLVKARMMPVPVSTEAPRPSGSFTVKLPKVETSSVQPLIAAEVSNASEGISITISGQLFAPAAKAATSAAAAPVKSKVEPAPKPEPAPKSEPAPKPAPGFGFGGFGFATGQAHRPATFTLPDPSPAEGIVSCPMSRGPPGCEAAQPEILGIRSWNEISFEEARLLCFMGTQIVAADKFPPTANTPSCEEGRLRSHRESCGNWAQLSWDESSTSAPVEGQPAPAAPRERVGAARIAL